MVKAKFFADQFIAAWLLDIFSVFFFFSNRMITPVFGTGGLTHSNSYTIYWALVKFRNYVIRLQLRNTEPQLQRDTPSYLQHLFLQSNLEELEENRNRHSSSAQFKQRLSSCLSWEVSKATFPLIRFLNIFLKKSV